MHLFIVTLFPYFTTLGQLKFHLLPYKPVILWVPQFPLPGLSSYYHLLIGKFLAVVKNLIEPSRLSKPPLNTPKEREPHYVPGAQRTMPFWNIICLYNYYPLLVMLLRSKNMLLRSKNMLHPSLYIQNPGACLEAMHKINKWINL